jgi:hypothetical protein
MRKICIRRATGKDCILSKISKQSSTDISKPVTSLDLSIWGFICNYEELILSPGLNVYRACANEILSSD